MSDIAKHEFVPLPDTPDQCARTGCGCFWNNYVAHNVFTDESGRPAKPPWPFPSRIEITADETGITITDTPPSTSDGMPATPELDKMSAVKAQSQPAGEFLEWLLGEKGYVLAQYHEGWNLPWAVHVLTEELLAEHFEIDLKKVEEERRAILAHIRGESPANGDG